MELIRLLSKATQKYLKRGLDKLFEVCYSVYAGKRGAKLDEIGGVAGKGPRNASLGSET